MHTHNCLDRNSPNSINFNLPFHVTYSLLIIIISIISILPFNHSSTTQTCHRLVLEGACWDGLKQLFHLCDRPINPAFRIYSKQFKSLWDPTAIRKGSQDPQILQTLAKHQWWNVKPSLYWFAYSSIHRRRAKSCEIAGFAEAASSASYKHRHFESPRPWCAYTGQGHWRYFFCRIGPRHLFQQYTNQTMNPKAIQPSVPQSNLHNGRKFVCKQKSIRMNYSVPSITSHFKQASNVPPQQSQELQGDLLHLLLDGLQTVELVESLCFVNLLCARPPRPWAIEQIAICCCSHKREWWSCSWCCLDWPIAVRSKGRQPNPNFVDFLLLRIYIYRGFLSDSNTLQKIRGPSSIKLHWKHQLMREGTEPRDSNNISFIGPQTKPEPATSRKSSR